MKSQFSTYAILLALATLTACTQTQSENVTNTDSLAQSAQVQTVKPATGIAALAKVQFLEYSPKLEDSDMFVNFNKVFIGDFTGDGKADAVVSYYFGSKGGGNADLGGGIVLYKSVGNGLQMLKNYVPNYPFYGDTIKNGKIFLYKTEWKPGDPYCCPTTKYHIELSFVNDTLAEKQTK